MYYYCAERSLEKKETKEILYTYTAGGFIQEGGLLPFWDSITRGDSFASERPIFYICERVRASILFLFCFLRCSAPCVSKGDGGIEAT